MAPEISHNENPAIQKGSYEVKVSSLAREMTSVMLEVALDGMRLRCLSEVIGVHCICILCVYIC